MNPIAIFLLAVGGCSPESNHPEGKSGLCTWTGDRQNHPGTVIHEGSLFAIWSNAPNTMGGSSSRLNKDGLIREGKINTAEGRVVSFRIISADRISGSVLVEGTPYDLAGGRLFLVKDGESGPRIEQLNRNLDGFEFNPLFLKNVSRDDPEIASFFGEPVPVD